MTFVKHHDAYCCVNSSGCPELGVGHQEGAARFLAGVLAEDLSINRCCIDNANATGAYGWLLMSLPKANYGGSVKAGDPGAIGLARVVAFSYYQRRNAEFTSLARLFATREDAEASVAALVREKLPNIVE